MLLIALASCLSAPETPQSSAARPLAGPVAAVDLDPSADVVEVRLEARPASTVYVEGRPTKVWAYDGHIPGPLIEARVGNRVIVHLTNALPQETSIHWHGVRVPADMDGMRAIAPGETFTYEFVVPDAGLYWYHPHFHTNEQVERGLYGTLLVREDDGIEAPERVMVLDDVLVDGNGVPLPTGSHSEQMMGREGNVTLVNGQPASWIEVRSGTWERWRVVNAANARYFPLAVSGAEFVKLGTDGGFYETPFVTDTVVLTPGERADFLVHFTGAPGTSTALVAKAHDRGHGIKVSEKSLFAIRYSSDTQIAKPRPAPDRLRTITPLVVPTGAPRQMRLGEGMHMGAGLETTFTINGHSWPDVPPVEVMLGDTEVWEVINETEMDHPFHVHGFFFQPLSLGGVELRLQRKDTLSIPAKTTLRFAIRYDDHPGHFMYHCHILEHAELGMAGTIEVMP